MGSRRTHEERLARLEEAGLSKEEVARLSSPIGLDLGARTPEETAISIAAEVIAETGERALELSFPSAALAMNKIGRERGWQPLTRADYEAAATLRGANFVGSPEQVAEKILFQHELFRHDRFLLQLSVGSMPHADMLRAIDRKSVV